MTGANGAASYLAKYLDKSLGEARNELGMVRRWSTSRNWPKQPRRRLEAGRGGWIRHLWQLGSADLAGLPQGKEMIETEVQAEAARKAAARRFLKGARAWAP